MIIRFLSPLTGLSPVSNYRFQGLAPLATAFRPLRGLPRRGGKSSVPSLISHHSGQAEWRRASPLGLLQGFSGFCTTLSVFHPGSSPPWLLRRRRSPDNKRQVTLRPKAAAGKSNKRSRSTQRKRIEAFSPQTIRRTQVLSTERLGTGKRHVFFFLSPIFLTSIFRVLPVGVYKSS